MSKGSVRSSRKKSSQDAVTEPLEVPLRALLGRQGRDQVTSPNQIKPLHVIANEKLKRFFFALVQR